jgi:hypothetical protein
MYNITFCKKIILQSFVGSAGILALVLSTFLLAEPAISHSQLKDTEVFRIRQTIVDETSFLVPPTNVTMGGSGINGVTGGQATGTTQFVVKSNNSTGYYVDIAYQYLGNEEAMVGDVTGSEAIRDYGDNAGEPTYNLTASTAAQFAYTVFSSSTNNGDTDASFKINGGSACGGTTPASGINCWKAPQSAPFRIVDRGVAATTGATSTIVFNVTVPNGAVPIPQAETYTATATLSLYIQ